jgi:ribonuclease P/MRP protein subunit POP5
VEFIPCQDSRPPKNTNGSLDGKQIWAALKDSVLTNFGDTGWGAVGNSLTGLSSHCCGTSYVDQYTVKYYSPTTNICIIRVARDHHQIAWGAVTFLSEVEGQKFIPNVIHVSGACCAFN